LSFPHYFCLNDTATTHIYTLSLHDALPIYLSASNRRILAKILWKVPIQRFLASLAPTIFEIRFFISRAALLVKVSAKILNGSTPDRKSTRLNSSHVKISYAVFCLKKKKKKK